MTTGVDLSSLEASGAAVVEGGGGRGLLRSEGMRFSEPGRTGLPGEGRGLCDENDGAKSEKDTVCGPRCGTAFP